MGRALEIDALSARRLMGGMATEDLICERRGAAGFVVLNRPQALNAITPGMVDALEEALIAWANDDTIERVVICGAGERAFCAGGDIRLVHDLGKAGRFDEQRAFYAHEYRVNRMIARYAKPFVALLDGYVMGGGAGVSIHGSHRIASERMVFAMPEVGIGFFPDVGATAFLPRLPDAMGTYLGVTGARITTGDAIALGIAQAHVPSAHFGELKRALEGRGDTDAMIDAFACEPPPAKLLAHRQLIREAFAAGDVATMLQVLGKAVEVGDDFARQTLALLRAKSPTSIAIGLRQLTRSPLTIEEALRLEYRLVSRVCRWPDFYEGIRAVIIDKDQKPTWSPARLEDVDMSRVEAAFAPLPDDLVFAGED